MNEWMNEWMNFRGDCGWRVLPMYCVFVSVHAAAIVSGAFADRLNVDLSSIDQP